MNNGRLLRVSAFLCILSFTLIAASCAGTSATTNPGWCSVQELVEQAEAGDADSQYRVGNLYADGSCFLEDRVKAVGWYEKAAKQGYTDAMIKLADAYRRGWGVQRDLDEAEKWYRMAGAENGLTKVMKLRETLHTTFGRIAVVTPRTDSEIEAPESAVEGIPLGARLIAAPIVLTLAVLSGGVGTGDPTPLFMAPGSGKVRTLQEKLAAAYARGTDDDVPLQLQKQVAQVMNGHLENHVFAAAVEHTADTGTYGIPTAAETVLEITPTTAGLQLEDTESARFAMIVGYRLVRAADGTLVDEGEIRSFGPSRAVEDWVAEDGAAVRTGFQDICMRVADRIVEKLLWIAETQLEALGELTKG